MKRILTQSLKITTLLLYLTITSCDGSDKELTIDERYPKPWRETTSEELVSIGRALVKNNVKGCGEYYVRPSSQDEGEYLVGCTRDGESWKYYMVWPLTEAVMGPYTDTEIEKPH